MELEEGEVILEDTIKPKKLKKMVQIPNFIHKTILKGEEKTYV